MLTKRKWCVYVCVLITIKWCKNKSQHGHHILVHIRLAVIGLTRVLFTNNLNPKENILNINYPPCSGEIFLLRPHFHLPIAPINQIYLEQKKKKKDMAADTWAFFLKYKQYFKTQGKTATLRTHWQWMLEPSCHPAEQSYNTERLNDGGKLTPMIEPEFRWGKCQKFRSQDK